MVPSVASGSQYVDKTMCPGLDDEPRLFVSAECRSSPTGAVVFESFEDSMFIGCSTNGFYPNRGIADALAQIGALGFTHAEVMLYHQRQYTASAFREYDRAARASGVDIVAIHLEPDMHMPFDPDAAVVADAWHAFDQAIEGALIIGAKTIVWQGPIREEYPIDAGFDPMLDVIVELDRRCQAAGVRLAVENCEAGVLATLRDFIEIGPRLPATVGFAFDPHHAAASRTNPMLLLRQMSGRLFDVHLRDFDEQGKRPGN